MAATSLRGEVLPGQLKLWALEEPRRRAWGDVTWLFQLFI